MPASVPRVRRLPIPQNASLIVRGDGLDEVVLRADAVRFHRRFEAWGRFGVSALLAVDDAEITALCATRLEHFATVAILHRAELERRGIEVVPTFRTPHVTLAHPRLNALVTTLLACEHRVIENPYFER